ncbi:MAG: hypothetical protein FWD55_07485 [Propionibacteriaceae bacterium]|nr:hypothetical protein [Propionibacteriaceae bacterium]
MKTILRTILRKVRHSVFLFPSLTVLGAVVAAVLTFLGTTNWWLTVLAGLGAAVVMRVWWIVEHRNLMETSQAELISSSGQLTQAMNSLALEVADLSVQVQTMSDKK